MLRKGFTLIELLIVITIIAILAGAAVPYVQDYVEDARYAKAKADLDEIRNALIRFETDRGTLYATGDIGNLVGPYLSAAIVDPWGGSYVIEDTKSLVSSPGPDGDILTLGDNVSVDYRPPLAISKVYWEDIDKSGTVSNNDVLSFKFTRPVAGNPAFALAPDDLTFSANAPTTLAGTSWSLGDRQAKLVVSDVSATPFIPGKTTVIMTAAGAAKFQDGAGNNCKNSAGSELPIKAR